MGDNPGLLIVDRTAHRVAPKPRHALTLMQERPDSNPELENHDIFEVFNQYFLLFFSLSCIMSSVFIQQVFISFERLRLGIALSPLLGIIAPMFLLTRRFRPGFRQQFRIRGVTLREVLLIAVGTAAMVVIVDYVYIVAQNFMPAPVDYLEGIKELKPTGAGSIVGTFVGLCVIVPIAEEIVFRGVIQHVFTRNMGGMIGVALASVFFGVIPAVR